MNPLPTNHRFLVIDDNRAIHEDFRKIFAPRAAEPSSIDLSEFALLGGSPVPAAGPGFEIDSAFQGEEGCHLVVASLQDREPAIVVPELYDLWHEPWAFALVIVLVASEWILRRVWGLR